MLSGTSGFHGGGYTSTGGRPCHGRGRYRFYVLRRTGGGFSPSPRLQIRTRGMKNKKSTRIPGVFPVRPCTGLQYSLPSGKRKAFSKKIRHFRRFSADCTNRCPFPAFFFARFSKSWTALLAGSDAIFPQVFQAVPGRDPGRGGPFFLATGFDTKPHTAAQLLLDNFRKTHYHK